MKKIYLLSMLLAFIGTTVWAQLPYNTTYTKSHFDDSKVTVSKKEANWDNSNGVRLGNAALGGFNWKDKYIVIALNQQSVPYQLSFQCRVSSTAVSSPKWYVSESSDNTNWTEIWMVTPGTTSVVTISTDWVSSTPITVSKSAKYIRIGFTGNFAGYLKDIVVSDQAYVHNPKVGDEEISALDFGANTISSGVEEMAFDVEWCNVDEMTVTSDNELFTVSPASFGGKAKYGTQTITVGYNRDQEIGEHSGTITLTNGSVTKTVTVSGSTTKREQAIHWNADLEATNFTLNAEDVLTGTDLATADNEEAEITYTSDNIEVIAVSEDGKTLYAIDNGTATITAFASGNGIYKEGTASQQFTVTSNKKQVIVWDQNFMSLKTNADPNTIELTATATSGGEVTYALEEGSDNCVTLNGSVLTITGTPGVAYIVATQAGGEINEEVWIAATARKQIKVRDPQSACDEYALADAQYTFEKGDKSGIVYTEFGLEGKPTDLSFYAKRGSLKYIWEKQTPLYIDEYANFGSGLEWRQVTSVLPTEQGGNFGPFALQETATKIRFRTSEYAEQNITNISVPRKKELVVSETNIVESAERNVRWSKTISVSRSNVDVVDILVEPNSQFEVSKTSIGSDCADHNTETFEVFFTPSVRDSVYTGSIVITDGKANPTSHTITLNVTCTGYNQSLNGFVLPTSCMTTETVEMPQVTATSGLEVVFLSSDSTIAYVQDNKLVILSAGTVDITAYQAGDDKFNSVSETQTIGITLTPVTILEAPTATEVAYNAAVSMALLKGGKADVPGSFAWADPDHVMTESADVAVLFTPTQEKIYATATVNIPVTVTEQPATYGVYDAVFCEGDSIEFAGKWYFEATKEDVTLEEKNSYGGDSIVTLTVSVLPVYLVEETDTVEMDSVYLWRGEILPTNEIGTFEYTAKEKTIEGCDSVVTLYLTVEKMAAVEEFYPIGFCAGDSAEYRGKWYYESGEDTIRVEDAIRDTVIYVTVAILPVLDQTMLDADTLHVGDTLLIEPNVWYMGETLLTDTFIAPIEEGEFDLIQTQKNVYGCDSVIVRPIVVLKKTDTPTGFESLRTAEKAVKEFRNGVIYIRRGEHVYSTSGLKAE